MNNLTMIDQKLIEENATLKQRILELEQSEAERKKIEDTLRENEKRAKRFAKENDVIAEIGRIISSAPKIEDVYEHFAEKVRTVIPFDQLSISTVNTQDHTRTQRYMYGTLIRDDYLGKTYSLAGTTGGHAVSTKSSLLFGKDSREDILKKFPLARFQFPSQSKMIVPLLSKGIVIALLTIQSAKIDAYSEKDLRLAERVCAQIAGSIANAELFLEHKQAMEALKESENRYSSLASTVDSMALVDRDCRFLFANDYFLARFGSERDSVIGRRYAEFHNDETSRIFANAVQYVFETGNSYQDEWFGKKSGLWLVRTFSPVKNVEGNIVAVTIVSIDITDRKRTEEALRESEKRFRELSIIDDLTQLYNSRYFYHQLRTEIDRVNRYGQPLTLLLLDLDDFKAFNDAFGHVEGDKVLSRVGQVVKRWLRQTDSAYRYGGEEFTILLPMTTSKDGVVTAERIKTEFKKETFIPEPDKKVHVTLSIGLAEYKANEDMKDYVHRVDQLMYQGKKEGKDRVCSECREGY